MRPSLFFHSWPYHLKYIKHFTNINSVLNYFYLRSLPLQKHFFSFFHFGGKNNLERNLFWLNVLCILNDMAMNERIKKVSSIFYYQILNESKNKKTLKNRVFVKHFLSTKKSLKFWFNNLDSENTTNTSASSVFSFLIILFIVKYIAHNDSSNVLDSSTLVETAEKEILS